MDDLEGLDSPTDLTELERRIVAEAQRFELAPLLAVLQDAEYSRDDVLFESEPEGRSPGVVRAVRFVKRPIRCAIVTVQFGLLGDNTLLPSYFFRLLEQSPNPARFYDFLRFFDHKLIENFFAALHPELVDETTTQSESVFVDYRNLVATFLQMATPGSLSTLHWLFQLYFPEFGVRVSRQAFADATDSHACEVGRSSLDGSGVLGRTYVTEMAGFLVDLVVEDEVDSSGREQADIVLWRLRNRVLPRLAEFRLALTVRLVVLWHASAAHVDDPRAMDKSFLGYNRLRGNRPKPEVRHTTLMYRGRTHEVGHPPARESTPNTSPTLRAKADLVESLAPLSVGRTTSRLPTSSVPPSSSRLPTWPIR
ncbi:MAG TPA: hypothetical protein VFQ61_02140 [Polyangiaceae bacterium]|nr:hypothetical protein [Polyangiaceae bacterium]